jgi:hypothetical protein
MGSPVLPQFSLCTCRRHYPGEAAGCLSFSSPAVAAFPVISPGQPSHRCFRGLLNVYSRYSPHTRGVAYRPFPSKASDRSLPSRLLRLLPAGTTLAGRDLHPLKNCAFPRHTISLRSSGSTLASLGRESGLGCGVSPQATEPVERPPHPPLRGGLSREGRGGPRPARQARITAGS